MDELEELILNSAAKINIKLDKNMLKQFKEYKTLLLEWNKRINLTSILDEKEIILKHFIDSISVLNNIKIDDNASIIDVGTGAGFPGIPIKIVKPNYNITLLDSLNKRVKFLNTAIEKLELNNINTIHGRAEVLGREDSLREKFDIAVSRAVSNLSTLCEYTLPFVKVGGCFISFKGPNVKEEIECASNSINALGGRVNDIIFVNIPETDIKHSLIVITKVSQTCIKYPRSTSKIKRNPIL